MSIASPWSKWVLSEVFHGGRADWPVKKTEKYPQRHEFLIASLQITFEYLQYDHLCCVIKKKNIRKTGIGR